ncbi:MAG: ribonuclease III [Candidatus Eisenbacteria bacterium]|nr:ribonuclease III [Candidatus Eisenbacteria bacterium]
MAITDRVLRGLAALTRRGPSPDEKRRKALRKLCGALGVRFRDIRLLNQALMHRSYSYEADLDRHESNERMEFLGDAVLGLVVNEHLYATYAEREEGRLTKIKSLLVSEAVLSRTADELSLGDFVLLSDNERQSGGGGRASIIADALEAVIAAIYLDSGLPAARRFIQRHLLAGMDDLLEVDEYKNYKSMIQEHAQRKMGARPRYRVVSVKGPEHQRVFFVELKLGGRAVGRGEGKNKKEAEQAAARSALGKLGLLNRGGEARRQPRSASRRSRGRGRRKESSR